MSIGIYKITNLINGKYYIGQSGSIEQRFKEHKYKASHEPSMLIHKAMAKYGVENFSFEVIEYCSLKELNEKEAFWIDYYDSTNREKGYNYLSGGENGGFIYAPEPFYKLWDEGKTVGEISEILHVNPKTVTHKLTGYNDYSVQESNRRGGKIAGKKILQKQKEQKDVEELPDIIFQYSLNGDFIAGYPSYAEAARTLNVKYEETLGWAAKGLRQTAYGYQWKFFKQDKINPVPKPQGKLIQCIETGKIYPSSKEAAKDVGLKSKTGILNCCAGRQKTAGCLNGQKLTWKYYEE